MERLRQLPLRLLAIIIALVLAAVATFALRDYVRDAEEDALAEVELVEVLQAAQAVAAGTPVADAIQVGAFTTARIPRESLPAEFLTSLDQVAGLVVATPLLQGEILQPGRFAAVAEVGSALEIPAGFQAMSLQVSITEGVANFLNSGDHVNILAHLIPGEEDTDVVTTNEGVDVQIVTSEDARTRFLLQDVLVLQVGRRVIVVDETGATRDTVQREDVLITVAVAAEDAERLAFAIREANLYLTLLPQLDEGEEYQDVVTPGRTADNLYE